MKDGLFSDSSQFRARAESKKLLDLGCTIDEKYGSTRGWELTLRKNVENQRKLDRNQLDLSTENLFARRKKGVNDDQSDEPLEFRENLANNSGLTVLHKDHRMDLVEVIRKTK